MLHVHHGPHASALASALADLLADPPEDVFATDLVAVHSRGLEQWLAQRLAHHLGTGSDAADGICAAIDFPFPGALVSRALGDASGVPPDQDPWQVDRSAWSLLGLLVREPQLVDDTPLHQHVVATGDGSRFAAIRRVADLFDRYAVHRPGMLVRWADGATAQTVDEDGRPLPASAAWQARLWRALREELGVPSPAERLQPALDRLIDTPATSTLPARLALFGLTALPASYLAVLRALAVHRDVHLFLSHPSPELWHRGAETLARLSLDEPPRREQDPLRESARNPILRAWGRDAREMQVVLAATQASDTRIINVDLDQGHGMRGVRPVTTLLERIHADIRGDHSPPGPPGVGQLEQRPALAPDDASVQIHACHGAERQVEVLRDLLLHRLAADPTLQPRDILVMCPDVEQFAPLIESVFPRPDQDQTPDDRDFDDASGRAHETALLPRREAGALRPASMRVRVSDRSLKRTNPVLQVAADLLQLADGRVSAPQVLDLAGRSVVRERFGFDDEELERIDVWVRELNIRWGFDGDHRASHDVPTAVGTWRHGLDRLLVGVAMADEDARTFGGVVPHDDVTTSDIDLAGRFTEFLARLEAAVEALGPPRAMSAWRDALNAAIGWLTDADSAPWQGAQLREILDELAGFSRGAEPVDLDLQELRGLLTDRLDGMPGRSQQRTGDLIVCSLVPMRSVPHRVVCLLGMDDGAFPRGVGVDGDDLLERAPRVGDRDPRTEDRQLLLDAVLAAEEALIITYRGYDERTNESAPPAVPVGELLEIVDRTVTPTDPDRVTASAQITRHHPLHAFDPANFIPGLLGVPDQPLGSDPQDLAGARAITAPSRTEPAAFLTSPLDPGLDPDTGTALTSGGPETVIELADFVQRIVHPVPSLLAERLGLSFFDDDRVILDELTVELDGLGAWQVGEPLLTTRLEGGDPERALALERGRGTLPPGHLATSMLEEIDADIEALLAASATHAVPGGTDRAEEVDLPLGDGRRLVGTVDRVVGDTIRNIGYARLRHATRLENWIRLVVLTAADPSRPWRAITLGRVPHERRKRTKKALQDPVRATAALLAPFGEDRATRSARAHDELRRLVWLHDRAIAGPVPVLTKTSAAYAQSWWDIRGGRRLMLTRRARDRWEGTHMVAGEREQPAYGLVFGTETSLNELLDPPADERETGVDWNEDEPSRFGRWALRLWTPILAHEQLEDHS